MHAKILVPYDASEYSNEAFKEALDIAKKYGAKIQVISVLGKEASHEEIRTLEQAIELQDKEENMATKIFLY